MTRAEQEELRQRIEALSYIYEQPERDPVLALIDRLQPILTALLDAAVIADNDKNVSVSARKTT